MRLLCELGEEADDLGRLNKPKVLEGWRAAGERFQVFAATDDSGAVLGLLTLSETFAIYANGNYGVIDEMYVVPEHRSTGVGKMLLNAVKEYGRRRGWSRIDVTAPESVRWDRTRQFYEREGFAFTGPKLKFVL